MPELPEVEVVRRGLAAALEGRTITSVELVGPLARRAVRRHDGGPADFAARLMGRGVAAVRRRGKYLWWQLDGDDALVAHLGMSGQFRVRTDGSATEVRHSHTRAVFHLDDGSEIAFLDQRTFGSLALVPAKRGIPVPISHIALDPLDPAFRRATVVRAIRTSDRQIKRILLDQTVVSGIGNIYADEALWAARLHYATPATRLSARRVGMLVDAAAEVMCQALGAGGTSFDALYVNVNGESGYFDRSLDVYGRAGRACRRCGGTIVREPFMNRSSFRCPRCQPKPSASGGGV